MRKRNSTFKVFLAGLVLFAGTQAQADIITIDPALVDPITSGSSEACTSDENCDGISGTSFILSWLTSQGYDVGTEFELYKSEVDGGAEEGPYADNYSTVYSGSADDPSNGTISHDGDGMITSPEFLLVKDGNTAPIWYLYDISDWDGWMDIELVNFWPEQGAISFVAIYGDVPEPATLVLFGAALIGLGLIRRRKIRQQS